MNPLTVKVEDGGRDRDTRRPAERVVDHLDAVRERIVLDVQRLTSLLRTEIGSRRLKIVVVGLPHHRRPARMTHPEKKTCPALARRFEHPTVAVIVDELRPPTELLSTLCLSEALADQPVKLRSPLCTHQRVVMLSPFYRLRPQGIRTHCAAHALDVHHVGHPPLGMNLSALTAEVFFHRQCPVGTATAHTFRRRVGDIVHAGRERMHILAQLAVDGFRRESLVASAIEGDARMASDTPHVVFGIAQEEHVVVRVRTVGRVGKPEVLPYHDTVSVARLVESLVAHLSYPVANHVEVHVAMIPHGDVVLTGAVEQVMLVESPVSS